MKKFIIIILILNFCIINQSYSQSLTKKEILNDIKNILELDQAYSSIDIKITLNSSDLQIILKSKQDENYDHFINIDMSENLEFIYEYKELIFGNGYEIRQDTSFKNSLFAIDSDTFNVNSLSDAIKITKALNSLYKLKDEGTIWDFENYKKEDCIFFIENNLKFLFSGINENSDVGLGSVESKCYASYYTEGQTLINPNHCSSTLWLENLPYKNNLVSPYVFEFNFSLTPGFSKIENNYPLQIMLGNSPNGYTWLGVYNDGTFQLSYTDKDGFRDLITVFKADRIYLDKPNHIKFIWFPNGHYYLELNSYKKWSYDYEDSENMKIPILGISNRIVFYSDVIIDSMYYYLY